MARDCAFAVSEFGVLLASGSDSPTYASVDYGAKHRKIASKNQQQKQAHFDLALLSTCKTERTPARQTCDFLHKFASQHSLAAI